MTPLALGAGVGGSLGTEKNNQLSSTSQAHCNETGIYFLFPAAVAPVRHDSAYAELFRASLVEAEGKNNNSNNLWSITSWNVVRRRRGCRADGGGSDPNSEETLGTAH